MRDPYDFFVAGGTLRVQAPSYVSRPADQDLYESVRSGEFCYVLTARQLGKSSLMVRTAERLRVEGIDSAIVDLTSIGTVPAEEWYLGLLARIRQALRLTTDLAAWWTEHAVLGASQRFTEFLRDIVLAEAQGPIVIFIDEIDSTLNLPFRDDFFAAIRAIYNARASEPIFNRLTFVLLGVATPTELIRDRDRTPFNIGRAVALGELSYDNAAVLRDGLEVCHPGYGDVILRRIFYWTNGHPYLTQRLCLAASICQETAWDARLVDALVEESFLCEEGRHDTNLTFIQDRIAASRPAERRDMLRLYAQLLADKKLPDDDRSPIQNRLELYGLIRVEDGRIGIHNRLYRQVFDRAWVQALTPTDTSRRTAIIAVLAALALIAEVVLIIITRPKPSDIRRDLYVDMFNKATSDMQRLEALDGLYGLEPVYWEKAAELFYGLDDSQQESLFALADAQPSRNAAEQLVTVVGGLSLTLDWMPERRDRILMSQMIEALKDSRRLLGLDAEAERQLNTLMWWQEGRDWAQGSEYDKAISKYSEALKLNSNHVVILYDRAKANVSKQPPDYERALNDLEEIVLFVTAVFPTPTPLPTGGPSTTASVTLMPQPTDTATGTPIPGSPSATGHVETAVTTAGAIVPVRGGGGIATATIASGSTNVPSKRPFRSRFINADEMLDAVAQLLDDAPGLVGILQTEQDRHMALVATAGRLGMAKFLMGCVNTVVNGEFTRGLANWQTSGDPASLALVTYPVHSPPYAIQLGPVTKDLNGLASIRQAVTIPADYLQATLGVRVYTTSQPDAGADYQEVALSNVSGGPVFVPWRVQENNEAWTQLLFDVSPFIGQTVSVSFSVNNDGVGGRTAMIVDDVRLLGCRQRIALSATQGLPQDATRVALARISSIEPDTDRPGLDYTNFELTTADPALCQAACQADVRCLAYTYAKPETDETNAQCYLKSGVPEPKVSDCCVSGAIAVAGTPMATAGPTVPPSPTNTRTAPLTPDMRPTEASAATPTVPRVLTLTSLPLQKETLSQPVLPGALTPVSTSEVTPTVPPVHTRTPIPENPSIASNRHDLYATQAENGWTYLVEQGRNSGIFVAFDKRGPYNGVDCYQSSREDYVRICANGDIHPGQESRVAYRWDSTYTGPGTIRVHAHKMDTRCGDGIEVGTYIGQSGGEPSNLGAFSIPGGDGNGATRDYNVQLSSGSYVLVIADIKAEPQCDESQLVIDINRR